MGTKTKKVVFTAEEQARIDKVITVVGRDYETTATAEKTPEVVETTNAVEQAPTPAVKTFEQQREEFEKLRIYIKEKEVKLKQLEAIESNISGLENLQTENADCEEVPNIFSDGDEEENNFVLTLHGTRKGHRRPDHFKINNPAIIEEYLDLLIDRLRLRAETLRTEIAQA